ncbi:hypothetical protein [Absidia glauca]|uniref:Uncharacterized protein n=1 Tax=Absidia glauca TaxID=4829 RepID=A0A168Q7J8_ABSGL|nr:hypothetical protein [Absidia glauca]
MEEVERSCRERKVEFDNKLVITSSGVVHLQVTYHAPTASLPPVAPAKKSKASKSAQAEQARQQLDNLKNQTNQLKHDLRLVKLSLSPTKKKIKAITDRIGKADDDMTRKQLIEERTEEKKQRDNTYRRMLEVYGQIDKINKDKATIYNTLYPKPTSSSSSAVPASSSSSSSSSAVPASSSSSSSSSAVPASSSSSSSSSVPASSPLSSPSCPFIPKETLYIGIDPGVKTMATAVQLDSYQAGAFLLLPNKLQHLSTDINTQQQKRLALAMKVPTKEIRASSIASRSRSNHSRKVMETKKKQATNDQPSIQAIESRLGGDQMQYTWDRGHSIQRRLETAKEHRPTLVSFYRESSWAKKQANGRKRFSEKAYAAAARSLFHPSSKHVVFFGDAGRGYGSTIKGHIRRSPDKLLAHLKERTTVIATNEYLSSKLCCFCNTRVLHPNKPSGKQNLGVVNCINPDCYSRTSGCSSRSRDKNAAINMITIGLHKEITGMHHPTFSPFQTTATAAAAAAAASTTAIETAFFGHITSWLERMGVPPSMKGTGDGRSLRT